MKIIFTLVIVILAIGYSRGFPTWGLNLAVPQRGPGWSENAGGLYPGFTNPYVGYGYAASSPLYIASYSQSPTFPGYTPGLYGIGYQNPRG